MTTKARCLLVLPVTPSPTGSGVQQRAYRWLLMLSRTLEVTVLVAAEASEVQPPAAEVLALASSIDILPVVQTMSWRKHLALWCPPLVLLRPALAFDWPALVTSPPEDHETFALYVVFRIRMHGIASVLRDRYRIEHAILDMDDLESSTLGSIARFALQRGRLRLALRSAGMACQNFFLERRLPRLYDGVCLANAEDATALRKSIGHASVFSLSNQVAVPTGRTHSYPQGIPTLTFLGTLSYFPNEDAALWIAESIVPLLRQRLGTPFRIRIAGRGASERLRARLADVPEIEFLGEVASVDSLYQESHLALVTVRCGGGTKVKALEAASFLCPIVATPHAICGLGFRETQDYLAGNTAEEIAQACIRLLTNSEIARSIAESAYQRLSGLSMEWERDDMYRSLC